MRAMGCAGGLIAAMGRFYGWGDAFVGARHARDGVHGGGLIAAMGRSYRGLAQYAWHCLNRTGLSLPAGGCNWTREAASSG